MVCPMTAIENFSDGYWWRSEMNILDSYQKHFQQCLFSLKYINFYIAKKTKNNNFYGYKEVLKNIFFKMD